MKIENRTLAELGEKAVIKEFLRPLFDGQQENNFLGNDCAIFSSPAHHDTVLSTDRVPADLIAFKHRIIGYHGLGKYLAVLNLSDLAASGADVIGLLLNTGIPNDLLFKDFQEFCLGFAETVESFGGRVLGGDITSSSEMSVSATAVGTVPHGTGLGRSGAKAGDYIFVSKSIGLTPAAFQYLLKLKKPVELRLFEEILFSQFRDMLPEISLGQDLRTDGSCTSCIDNTDGYSECLYELALESGVKMVVDASTISLADCVERVAELGNVDPFELAFSAGADFALVGTLDNVNQLRMLQEKYGAEFIIIGRVEEGSGVYLDIHGKRREITRNGWNYFL